MVRTVRPPADRTDATQYRDGSGRSLDDYPRPAVAVDTAVLTIGPDRTGGLRLEVLQVRAQAGHAARAWALPGTFLHDNERLDEAVRRSLRTKAGVEGLRPEQLFVLDDPARDDRGRVLSVAHVDVVPRSRIAPVLDHNRTGPDVRLTSATRPGPMPYDHAEIVRRAVRQVRSQYAATPDPARLLPAVFTLRELRLVHEAVAGVALQRDTFRRSMEPFVEPTGELRAAGRGRPAELFRRG